MVTYPIRVRRDGYRGADERKRRKATEINEYAMRLENHINEQLKNQNRPIQEYLYSHISRETDVPLEIVQRLCFSIDGGHNGFTGYQSGLTLQQALDLIEKASK